MLMWSTLEERLAELVQDPFEVAEMRDPLSMTRPSTWWNCGWVASESMR